MNAPTFDADLAYRVLAAIEANPQRWDQSVWRRPAGCGTAMCVAGWTAELVGATWETPDEEVDENAPPEDWYKLAYVIDRGPQHIECWASDQLGLGDDPLRLLEDTTHTLPGLRAIVDHYAAHGTSAEAARSYRGPQ